MIAMINIDDQLLSIDQMNILKEYGVNISDAAMVSYFRVGEFGGKVVTTHKSDEFVEKCHNPKDYIYRYSLYEILHMLPSSILVSDKRYYPYIDLYAGSIRYSLDDKVLIKYCNETEDIKDSAFDMLCWCIEHKYLDAK